MNTNNDYKEERKDGEDTLSSIVDKPLMTTKSREMLTKIEELEKESKILLDFNNKFNYHITESRKKSNNKEDLMNLNDHLISANKNLLVTNEKIIKANLDLAEINKDLVRTNDQLSYQQNQQQEFVNIVSHELRGSIHAILGYTEFLELNPPNSKEYTDRIKSNAERLNVLVLDILDVTRIENNLFALNLTQVNLNDIIFSVIEDVNQKIKDDEKRIEIDFHNKKYKNGKIQVDNNNDANKVDDIIITADKQKLIQVLSNILDNAIKFTKEGVIYIDLETRYNENLFDTGIDNSKDMDTDTNNCDNRQLAKEVIVHIKDSGKGIDSKVFSNLFSKFNSEPGSGGTGLGLFISKKIVESHGGKIWAENNKDKTGATFSFSLPLNK